MLLAVGHLGLSLWVVFPPPPVGFYWDDAWYLLMAEWLSGRAEHSDLASAMLGVRQYPPLYSLLLALFGAGVGSTDSIFVVNGVLATCSALLLVASLTQVTAKAWPSLAIAACLLLTFNPVALTWLPTAFSEHLFIPLTIAAFWLSSRANTLRDWWVLGLVVGCAMITRSAGIALVIACLLVVTRRGARAWGATCLGVVMAMIADLAITSGLPSAPNYRQTLQGLTLDVLTTEYLTGQLTALWKGYRTLVGSTIGATLMLVLMLPGWVIRLRAFCADAWYLPLGLAMLIVWPFPDHSARFLWPMMPAMLLAVAQTTHWANRVASPLLLSVPLWLIFALSLHAGLMLTVARLLDPPPSPLAGLARMQEWTRHPDRAAAIDVLSARQQLLRDTNVIQSLVPKDACIYSELPALVAIHAERVAYASPWPRLIDLDQVEHRCRFYYLVPLALPGTTAQSVAGLGERHRLLYTSISPRDPSGEEKLGVLIQLRSQP